RISSIEAADSVVQGHGDLPDFRSAGDRRDGDRAREIAEPNEYVIGCTELSVGTRRHDAVGNRAGIVRSSNASIHTRIAELRSTRGKYASGANRGPDIAKILPALLAGIPSREDRLHGFRRFLLRDVVVF